MMLILDAGAFVAAERGNREILALDILTCDPRDLLDLVRTAGVHVELIPV